MLSVSVKSQGVEDPLFLIIRGRTALSVDSHELRNDKRNRIRTTRRGHEHCRGRVWHTRERRGVQGMTLQECTTDYSHSTLYGGPALLRPLYSDQYGHPVGSIVVMSPVLSLEHFDRPHIGVGLKLTTP